MIALGTYRLGWREAQVDVGWPVGHPLTGVPQRDDGGLGCGVDSGSWREHEVEKCLGGDIY